MRCCPLGIRLKYADLYFCIPCISWILCQCYVWHWWLKHKTCVLKDVHLIQLLLTNFNYNLWNFLCKLLKVYIKLQVICILKSESHKNRQDSANVGVAASISWRIISLIFYKILLQVKVQKWSQLSCLKRLKVYILTKSYDESRRNLKQYLH